MQQITRISPCIFTNEYDDYNNPVYGYAEEIIVGADALRYRNGEAINSCAMGIGTTANTEGQVVIGKYNINNNALFIIGNGTENVKSNIAEFYSEKVIINGNLEIIGDITNSNLTVNNKITANELKITNIATIEYLKTSSFETKVDSLEINNKSNFNAPVRFKLSVDVDPDANFTVDRLRTSSNKYYMTTEDTYSKSYIDTQLGEIINMVNERLQILERHLLAEITSTDTDLRDVISSQINQANTLSLNRTKQLQYSVTELQKCAVTLGTHPKTKYTFAFMSNNIT